MSDWDYIIVGAGSSGCAVASELVKRGRYKVLLIESGGSNKSPYIRIPALLRHIDRKCYGSVPCQPDPSRRGRVEKWQHGHALGGSSSVNGMIFVRGAAYDFDRWASLGNRGWSYNDVLPIFKEMESCDQLGSTRGREGPIFVRTVRHPHPLTCAFVESAVSAGFPLNPDYNDVSQDGVSYVQLSQRNGLRWSAADAFVRPVLNQRNFRLLLNARVSRVHLDGGEATGVSYTYKGTTRVALGGRIVLCTGSVNTPKLLMMSGIGDPEELRRHGIAAHVDAPGVGHNLREHPLIRLIYRTRIPSNNLTEGVLQRLRIAGQFALHRSGPVSTAIEAIAFGKTVPTLSHSDVQIHFVTLGVRDFVAENSSPFLEYPSVTVYVNASHPRSSGRVRLASSNPNDAPLIECRLLGEDSRELRTLIGGVGIVRKIMATKPMSALVLEEVRPGSKHLSEGSLEDYVRSHTEIAYHAVGTCRMGIDPEAVVTPELKVRGVENLWIADASVMPDLISGNTNAACMMIGMKLGRQLGGS
jgi:choline dehydrogenase